MYFSIPVSEMNTMSDIRLLIPAALFAALTAIGAFIKIPLPPVPISLQTFFVVLAGLLLGAKYGTLSQILYLFIGLAGVPVFIEGGGILYILKPTFGYLIGFIFCAFTIGKIVHQNERELTFPRALYILKNTSAKRIAMACSCGILLIYIPGVAYLFLISHFYLESGLTLTQAVISGFVYFIIWDIGKIIMITFFVKVYLQRQV